MSLYLCGCSISPQLDECTEGKLLLDDVLMKSLVEAAYCPSRMVQWITDNNTTLGFWWHCSIFIVVDHNWMQCTLLVDVVAALYTILGLEAVVFLKVHDNEQTTRRQTFQLVLKVFLLFLGEEVVWHMNCLRIRKYTGVELDTSFWEVYFLGPNLILLLQKYVFWYFLRQILEIKSI